MHDSNYQLNFRLVSILIILSEWPPDRVFCMGFFWGREFHSWLMRVSHDASTVQRWISGWSWPHCLFRAATSLSASQMEWALRNHILSNQVSKMWMYHRIRCLLKIFRFTHRLRFSRPSWLHWWILLNIKGENNTNSSQIIS